AAAERLPGRATPCHASAVLTDLAGATRTVAAAAVERVIRRVGADAAAVRLRRDTGARAVSSLARLARDARRAAASAVRRVGRHVDASAVAGLGGRLASASVVTGRRLSGLLGARSDDEEADDEDDLGEPSEPANFLRTGPSHAVA